MVTDILLALVLIVVILKGINITINVHTPSDLNVTFKQPEVKAAPIPQQPEEDENEANKRKTMDDAVKFIDEIWGDDDDE